MTAALTLPPPPVFGLPEKFAAWRDGQAEAVQHFLQSDKRFLGGVLPTGFGKSLTYVAVAQLAQWRALALTSTLALQDQLAADLVTMDAARIKGQSRYLCLAMEPTGELFPTYGARTYTPVTVDHGPCHLGVDCALKAAGCPYYDAQRAVLKTAFGIGNYAWWFTLVARPDLKLQPDLLILDEAHAAPDALSDALGAELRARDVHDLLNQQLKKADSRSPAQWIAWAVELGTTLKKRMAGTKPHTRDAAIALRRAHLLVRQLLHIAQMDARLLLLSDTEHGVRFDLVWAAGYAESHLFRGAAKILLTSATFTSYTAELLGIAPADLDLYEAGAGFPLARRPVYILTRGLDGAPAPRLHWEMSGEDETRWLALIDAIIDTRLDRKGLIHTVSYGRRNTILARSRHRHRMLTHERHNTAAQIAAFRRAGPGTIFLSPALTTGYDFPYTDCEYQIVAKVPFPDARDPVVAARKRLNKVYPAHLAMQELVQSIGRSMRAADDRCETFICDRMAVWFLSAHANLAPKWFRSAVWRVGTIPSPPPPLGPIPVTAQVGAFTT